MTLIVGIKCSDGIVIGADGATTINAGNASITQPTTKLQILHNSLVIGMSGHVGLGQKHLNTILNLWTNIGSKGVPEFKDELHRKINLDVLMYNGVSQTGAQLTYTSNILLGFPLTQGSELVHCDVYGAVTTVSDAYYFFTIGSGSPTANALMSFFRTIYWPDTMPTVIDGVFAALWTLTHSTSIGGAVGVSEPIQVAVLQHTNGNSPSTARILSDAELHEHRQHIRGIENHMREYTENLNGLTQPPQAPSQPAT